MLQNEYALRASCVTVVLALFATQAVWSANQGPVTGTQQDANQLLNEQFGPFKLSVGENDAGGIGTNLNGDGRYDFGVKYKGDEPENSAKKFWLYEFPNLAYSATGTWSSNGSSTNNASLSLKPGYDGVVNYGRFYDPTLDPSSDFVPPFSPTANGHNMGM